MFRLRTAENDSPPAGAYHDEVTTATEALQRLEAAVADGVIDELCDRRRVRLLALFGSAVRGILAQGPLSWS